MDTDHYKMWVMSGVGNKSLKTRVVGGSLSTSNYSKYWESMGIPAS